MLTTVVAVLAAIALLVPGFLIAEIAIARGARSSRSDLELALRALVFALLTHLIFIWWTAQLVDRLGSTATWRHHVGALTTYVLVVLVAAPTAIGVLPRTIARMTETSTRLQEGALSARTTPTTPPAKTELVPVAASAQPKATQSADANGGSTPAAKQ
jgi:hypothetical protein